MTINSKKVIKALETTFWVEMSSLKKAFAFDLIDSGLVNRLGRYSIIVNLNTSESMSALHNMIIDGAAPQCGITLSRDEFADVYGYCVNDVIKRLNEQDSFKRRNINVLSYSYIKSTTELKLDIEKEHSLM